MKEVEAIIECLREFAGMQPEGVLDVAQLRAEGGITSMLQAANGMEIWFSRRATEHMMWLAQALHQNFKAQSAIRVEEFAQIVRQVLVDGYCDKRLSVGSPSLSSDVRAMVSEYLEPARRPLIHSFPGWSIDVETQPVHIGPVAIYSVEVWLERQQFAPAVRSMFFTEELPEEGWQTRFQAYRSGTLAPKSLDLASMLARAVADASHIVEVPMPPRETVLSRQQARLLAQAALDAVSLLMESTTYHQHWVLKDHPAAPESNDDITAFESGLWPPNAHKRWRRSPFSSSENWAVLTDNAAYLAACGHVLETIRNADQGVGNIQLAHRWFNALQWAASGAREPNDAIASSKYATSLDILALANGHVPIIEMIENALGIAADARVVKPSPRRPNGMTLKQAVELVYGEGRSRILHGNIVDPMHRHALERSVGGWLARACLRALVLAIPSAKDAEHASFVHLKLYS